MLHSSSFISHSEYYDGVWRFATFSVRSTDYADIADILHRTVPSWSRLLPAFRTPVPYPLSLAVPSPDLSINLSITVADTDGDRDDASMADRASLARPMSVVTISASPPELCAVGRREDHDVLANVVRSVTFKGTVDISVTDFVPASLHLPAAFVYWSELTDAIVQVHEQCISTCLHAHISARMYAHMSAHISMHMSTCTSTHMSAHMSTHMSAHISMHMSTHMSAHVYTHVYAHVYTHVY